MRAFGDRMESEACSVVVVLAQQRLHEGQEVQRCKVVPGSLGTADDNVKTSGYKPKRLVKTTFDQQLVREMNGRTEGRNKTVSVQIPRR